MAAPVNVLTVIPLIAPFVGKPQQPGLMERVHYAEMEGWSCIDERDIQSWKGGGVCMTYQYFVYGLDQHCRAMVGCILRQNQLQQG